MINAITEFFTPPSAQLADKLKAAQADLQAKQSHFNVACFDASTGDPAAIKAKLKAEKDLAEATNHMRYLDAALLGSLARAADATAHAALQDKDKLRVKLTKLAERLPGAASKADAAAAALGTAVAEIRQICDDLGQLSPVTSVEFENLFGHMMASSALPGGLTWTDPVLPRPSLVQRLSESSERIKESI